MTTADNIHCIVNSLHCTQERSKLRLKKRSHMGVCTSHSQQMLTLKCTNTCSLLAQYQLSPSVIMEGYLRNKCVLDKCKLITLEIKVKARDFFKFLESQTTRCKNYGPMFKHSIQVNNVFKYNVRDTAKQYIWIVIDYCKPNNEFIFLCLFSGGIVY